MIPVLVDSNVIVDFLAERAGFYEEARKLLVFSEIGDYELWMSSSQITDVRTVPSDKLRDATEVGAQRSRHGRSPRHHDFHA